MDNKITKKRVSNFLSYEWSFIIIISLVIVMLCELMFGFCATTLTTGQEFGIFFDKNVIRGRGNVGVFVSEALSYDILNVSISEEDEKEQMLRVKSDIHDLDIIFTDYSKAEEYNSIRAHSVVDNFPIIDFQSLLRDACDYIGKNFLKSGANYPYIEKVTNLDDGWKNEQDISMPSLKEKVEILTLSKLENDKIIYTNLDTDKIKNHFLTRMKNDNRYRTKEEKDAGVFLEIERINMLVKSVGEFYTFLEKAKDINGLLCNYTKYKQINELNGVVLDGIENYTGDDLGINLYIQELKLGRINMPYAINLGKLTYDKDGANAGAKKNIHEYVQLSGTSSAENVVLAVFDFTQVQPDTQYETISVINNTIKIFSDILD